MRIRNDESLTGQDERWPNQYVSATATGQSMQSGNQRESYSVLIMDDEPLVLSSISLLLKSLGHTVVQAEDGDEALQAADKQVFDVAILDLMVQDGRGGAEIADEFRQRNPDCRLVLSSGLGMETADLESETTVFDDRLPKPFSLDDLKQLFDRLFSGS